MPAFFSPLANVGTWTLSLVEETTIPAGLRYEGYKFRGVGATRGAAESVKCPALGVLRGRIDSGVTFVEIQVNPFPIRNLIAALPWGVPTFYLAFGGPTTLTAFADDSTAPGNEALATTTSVTIICAGQDRVALDPALWAQQITDAINAVGGNTTEWGPFAAAVSSAINTGDSAPVLLLDQRGQPQTSGAVDIIYGPPATPTATHHATLAPEDHGDLQKTVTRMNLAGTIAIDNLWGPETSFHLRPLPSVAETAIQLARLEDGASATGLIEVTPLLRHISYVNLHDWFAEQFAIPADMSAPPLQRFTRDNKVTPLVNGPAFFDDLFRRLQEARTDGGGFHLAGWAMFPDTELTELRAGEPSDLPLTLEQAAERIGAAGGGCRFLPARFIQLQSNDVILPAEAFGFFFIMTGIHVLNSLGVSFARTDAAGAVVLLALWVGSILFINYILDEDGHPLEPNKSAEETLGAIANTHIHLSPYPARVEDNPDANTSSFPFTTIFTIIRHFGVYHQKLCIVHTGGGNFFGYCGGIDLNPDRLDTADHLNPSPFHDLHARVEGPAVSDLALSFEQRWTKDAPGQPLAFTTPEIDDLGTPGTDIVQVARTYFHTTDMARRFTFAPDGDHTIADTMIKAITSAREFIYIEDQYFTPPETYADALVQRVAATDKPLRKLIVVLPDITDQTFGELRRSDVIADLRAADAGRGIVQVGYPRRHYTLPDNEIRAASGKCLLGEELPATPGLNPSIVLGPKTRVPKPPFWVAVEGELMWAYDEATDPPPDANTRRLLVVRGADTRFVKGGTLPKGTRTRLHKKNGAATVIQNSGIYVHAKMMIVDDVFLGLGSANLNRRGLFHDGEINIFTIPQALKVAANNPIAALRRLLWAEMLNLPADMAGPLLQDPLAASKLFDRSPFTGNRYVDIDAYPLHLMWGATTGDGIVSNVLQLLGFTVIGLNHEALFNTVIDPTS